MKNYINKLTTLDELDNDGYIFFDSMNREELNSFEKYYIDYLKKTTNDVNWTTEVNYTEEELEDLHNLCNYNLKIISLFRIKKNF